MDNLHETQPLEPPADISWLTFESPTVHYPHGKHARKSRFPRLSSRYVPRHAAPEDES